MSCRNIFCARVVTGASGAAHSTPVCIISLTFIGVLLSTQYKTTRAGIVRFRWNSASAQSTGFQALDCLIVAVEYLARTNVAPVVPRVFAFSMQAEQSIVVDPKSPGGINSPHGLILFDGVCVLCSRGCRFVSKRDRRGYFRFVPIQLAEGRPLAEQLGIDPDRPDSFAFVATGQGYVKSEAALRIARELPRWQWTWVFHFIPRAIRDAVYDLVARNRYRWFGRRDACILPNLDRSWPS
jgi:predicted DCC family thiol-disulfide oxidoreductase YuxK